ncbi:metal-dependent transcriptional regulator [Pseudactinotalea sp. HY160]|uniref:metal-dependent transcriptional regulator n=1 Tax=Pseudactinotalea sp. HY160 TaxID=2654490 RepID=UPI00128C1371|nr:metal-dependent transcriptional regulator [Pseudactinotalea sp. HY160]MPV48668.1 metal-dependent transcriptional regulator [Pseudactinotalea sp. HY160]
MSVSELTPSTQNYLKIIWGLQEWSHAPVTPSDIAQKAGLRMSSVSDAVRRLASQGFVTHTPYGAVALTALGRRHALTMVRRHRLIETFLVEILHYRWHEVHDEADALEHAVSDALVERIDALLGHPARDPHGDPIPTAAGVIHPPDAVQLSTVPAPATVTLERISDEDPALLAFCADAGIGVGSSLDLTPGPPYSDAVTVAVAGREPVNLGASATTALWVALTGR